MLPSAFPTGLRAWQVKTGAAEPNYITEIAKDGVQQTLGEGRDYVLVWTNDPPDRTALEEGIRDEVRKTHPDRTATLISIEELERFSRVHPGVVEAHSGPHLLGMPLAAIDVV
jgi:hypothetical protein